MIHWLIARYGESDAIDALAAAVARSGAPVTVAKCVPFGGVEEYPQFGVGERVFFVGPIFSVARIAQAGAWRPGVWYDEGVFACHTYYGYWARFILQRRFALLPLGVLMDRAESVYAAFERRGEIFIRPDSSLKLFDAERVAYEHFQRFLATMTNAEISPATLVVVSEPVDLGAEYRLVFRRGEYVTGSMYRNEDRAVERRPDVPEEVIAFGREVASRPIPGLPPVYCLDVGVTADGARLVELTSINAAGYYACDLDKVVGAVNVEAESL